jgi:hypothetical protein
MKLRLAAKTASTGPGFLVLVLGVVGGVVEYLNSQTFGITGIWHQALTFGVLLIEAYGVVPVVGKQLGVSIQNLLGVSPAVMHLISLAGFAFSAAVTTFGISGVLKGVLLGVSAIVLAVFGPPVPVPAPAPAVARR